VWYSCVAFWGHTTVSTVRQSYSLHPQTVIRLAAIATMQHRSVSKQLEFIVTEYIKNMCSNFDDSDNQMFNSLVGTV